MDREELSRKNREEERMLAEQEEYEYKERIECLLERLVEEVARTANQLEKIVERFNRNETKA